MSHNARMRRRIGSEYSGPILIVLMLLGTAGTALSQDGSNDSTGWRFEAGITFAHFQQQVKQEIGGARGERLVNETALGLHAGAGYDILDWLSGGIYVRTDFGERTAARFSGFDSLGRTVTEGALGGSYSEVWIGPYARFAWNHLSAEVGYGALGIRSDDARSDLPSSAGDTSSSFRTSPSVAWLVAVGAFVPITSDLDLTVKAEYRVRYYVSRGGDDILEGAEHGTQGLAPFIGIAYRL